MRLIKRAAVAGVLLGAAARGRAEAPCVVTSLAVRLDDRAPSVSEWPGYLDVQMGYASASAVLECRIPAGEEWTFGYIQQIDSMTIRSDYSGSYGLWELDRYPYLDGDRGRGAEFWYMDTVSAKGRPDGGPVAVEVSALDTPHGRFSWDDEPSASSGRPRVARDLRKVTRRQAFTTWLAARRKNDGRLELLKRWDWAYGYRIVVDPARPLGRRVRKNEPIDSAPVVRDPGPTDLVEMARDGVLDGTKSANRDQRYRVYAKTRGR